MLVGMSTSRLSHTSYLVLGLIAGMGAATPYELKQMVNASLGCFWSFPHSQLYSEPDRLADLGLLEVDQEATGRRRKRYTITDAGREALLRWLRDPDAERAEVREPGLLKLFFGGLVDAEDMTRLARARVKLYEQELERYTEIERAIKDEPDMSYPYATLRLGISWARACLAFWGELAGQQQGEPGRPAFRDVAPGPAVGDQAGGDAAAPRAAPGDQRPRTGCR
jgi:PadR family transcriptional regulator, regulatory protein AphA